MAGRESEMKDHLASENTQKIQCIYCANDLSGREWVSEFIRDLHYKATRCDCGKNIRMKVEFHGSGHDSWDGTKSWKKFKKAKTKGMLRTLESRIKKSEST